MSYIHPIRTYLPCTGAGRHINNTLLELHQRENLDLELLFSSEWLKPDGKLDARCPLREIPYKTFRLPENFTERLWKAIQFPKMDYCLSNTTDWLYAPMETYIPISSCPVAITIYDIQAFETNLPWSNTFHHRWFRYKWSQWIYRALADYQIIFTISEFSKGRMVELLGADANKIIVVGCGVESNFFDVATLDLQGLQSPTNNPFVLVVGGLRLRKGADFIFSVAKDLLVAKSNIEIVIVGSSEPQYMAAVKELPNIKLFGTVPDDDLPRLMRYSSSLLFLSHYEGFGIPALEAMAAGTPVVVANRASLPEVVGNAGIVVNPEASQDIADILCNLSRDPGLREKYIHRGYEHMQQYTWSRCTDRIVEALNSFG